MLTEHIPHLTVSSMAWPDINHELAFYNSFIKGRGFEHRFNKTYEPIVDMVDTSNMSSTEDIERIKDALKETNLIEDNFLKVHVIWHQYIFPSFVDEPKFTMAGILAQLGATLNLYAGITLILLFEILELVYNIGYAMCNTVEPVLAT